MSEDIVNYTIKYLTHLKFEKKIYYNNEYMIKFIKNCTIQYKYNYIDKLELEEYNKDKHIIIKELYEYILNN